VKRAGAPCCMLWRTTAGVRLPMPRPSDTDLERTYSRRQFAAKLRRLADSIERASPFTIQIAGERIRIPTDATFNIEHERSGDDEEIEFQLLWRRKSAQRGSRTKSRR